MEPINELLQVRKEKEELLKAAGIDPYPQERGEFRTSSDPSMRSSARCPTRRSSRKTPLSPSRAGSSPSGTSARAASSTCRTGRGGPRST